MCCVILWQWLFCMTMDKYLHAIHTITYKYLCTIHMITYEYLQAICAAHTNCTQNNSYSYSHTSTNSFIQCTVDCMFSEQEGAAAHWLQHWPDNCKLSVSMPMMPGCCFQGTFTPIAPVNSAGCLLCMLKP